MKYYIGVDGGGTKTELIVVSEDGVVVERRLAGSSNPNDIGKDCAVATLKGLVESAIPQDATCVDVALGIAGAAFSGLDKRLEAQLLMIDRVKTAEVCSDVQIALDAAYDGDGAIVIMGTGSVGYVRVGENVNLVGGCGYMLDASLSGYDVGREVLNAVLSAADGRGESTLLTALVEEKNIGTLREIVRDVYTKGKVFVASFAPLAFQAYRQGDHVAKEILQKCVGDFEKLLGGIISVGGVVAEKITLFGGLSAEWGLLSSFLSEGMKKKIVFFVAEVPPVFGAIKRAKKGAFEEDFFSALKRSYQR